MAGWRPTVRTGRGAGRPRWVLLLVNCTLKIRSWSIVKKLQPVACYTGYTVQVLSNLTRDLASCRQVVNALTKAGVDIAILMDLLSRYDLPLITCLSRDSRG